ncbi:MAG: MFS transporter, partial [Dehalococcoidia bacterium]
GGSKWVEGIRSCEYAKAVQESTPLERQGRLGWIVRDAWIIIAASTLRSIAQASIAVLLAPYLEQLGFSLGQIGLFITLGLAGTTVFSVLIVFLGESIGRRRLMTGFTVLTGVTGVALVLTEAYALLAFMAFVGAFNVAGAGPAGPVQPIERASITETVSPRRRTDLFALHGAMSIGGRAAGTLAAALPLLFQSWGGMSEIASFKVMFASFAAISVIAALLYAMLSAQVEVSRGPRKWTNPFTLPSRGTIFAMGAIMSVDSFATRLTVQTLVALWLSTKFGFDIGTLATIFFFTHLMNGASLWISARLSNRIGLLNTIVLTHIPAVVATLIFPFVPTAGIAVVLWLTRGFFSQMDTVPKQSYMMAIVSSEERVAIGGVNQLSQSSLGLLAPLLTTFLWSTVSISAPFIASGIFKVIYLASFYAAFRNKKPPEELEQQRAESTT